MVVYRWNGTNQRFDPVSAEPNPHATHASANVAPAVAPAAPNTAAAPTADAVIEQFRRSNGLAPNAAPRFSVSADVAGDSTPESVQIFGRIMVVSGPRFMGGRSYSSVELPADDDADVLGLTERRT